ncbi:hypothetical protein PR202_gb01430 [Eleusine coracana subsp. coracana]|uniref:PRA1 family protein n=1 Tax=Eleusine coracana subsp. coracana TaxID=191504 RepID=A0AAV5DWM6_ELECO|nr:hypothetical protein PR202_gb01430 [Eleusine coracana subsp. coracana]
MDWSAVTAEDLVDALREVDWSTPPRPVPEFFSRFTVPRSYSKWTSRLKCNLYYYRTNYFILIMFILGMGFLWKPIAVVAAFMTGVSIAFLNDSFAVTFNEKVTRTVRQFSPHLAAKMRPPMTWPCSSWSTKLKEINSYLWATSLGFCPILFCSLLTVLWALLIAIFGINCASCKFQNT